MNGTTVTVELAPLGTVPSHLVSTLCYACGFPGPWRDNTQLRDGNTHRVYVCQHCQLGNTIVSNGLHIPMVPCPSCESAVHWVKQCSRANVGANREREFVFRCTRCQCVAADWWLWDQQAKQLAAAEAVHHSPTVSQQDWERRVKAAAHCPRCDGAGSIKPSLEEIPHTFTIRCMCKTGSVFSLVEYLEDLTDQLRQKLAAKTRQHEDYKRNMLAVAYGGAPSKIPDLYYAVETTPGQPAKQDGSQILLGGNNFLEPKPEPREIEARRERAALIPTTTVKAKRPVVHLRLWQESIEHALRAGSPVFRLACGAEMGSDTFITLPCWPEHVNCPACHDSAEWNRSMLEVWGIAPMALQPPMHTQSPLAELARQVPKP